MTHMTDLSPMPSGLIWMPSVAVGLALRAESAAFQHGIDHVLFVRPKEEMIWANTTWIVAAMTDLESKRNLTNKKQI